ncbi:uracil-xanthine permease family protein [Candidatus Pelagibacter sp.]|uniref:uracil-xanthine permease family protein n=1 Tax=Candidatus Pelagibacter sp. TaxID=2024849 RepID=UPI000141B4CA|nr:purine permease [Candidatus Pelagibacter sp.]MDC2971020.1 purine permease [Candidatus Pelagibacter sp.]
MASRKTKAGSTNSPDKKLPLNKSIPLGIQHVLAMFAGNITVPIIVAGVFGQTPEQKIFLIQMALFVAGVATIIQTVGYKEIGARLPIVQGTSFAFIPIMLPFKAAGLGAVFTAAFIGGIFQIFIGKVLKPIRHLFPPLVTGIVVLMIGFSLLKVGFMYAGGGGWLMNNKPEIFANANHLTVAASVFIVAIFFNLRGKGMASAASILIGIVAGFIVAAALGMVNYGKIASAAWFAFPMPLQYGIDFVPGAIILMLFMSVVTTIETIGDISATTMGGAKREATDKEISGGIMADGVGTAFGAIFNAMPNTSYSQNAGLVAFTGVVSRHVGTIAGIVLVLMGLFPKLGGIIAAMPESVIGGAAIIMFGMIVAAGIKLISRAEMDQRNLLILALSLSFGIGMSLLPDFVKNIPDFGISLKLLLTTGLIPAGLLAFALNAIMAKK